MRLGAAHTQLALVTTADAIRRWSSALVSADTVVELPAGYFGFYLAGALVGVSDEEARDGLVWAYCSTVYGASFRKEEPEGLADASLAEYEDCIAYVPPTGVVSATFLKPTFPGSTRILHVTCAHHVIAMTLLERLLPRKHDHETHNLSFYRGRYPHSTRLKFPVKVVHMPGAIPVMAQHANAAALVMAQLPSVSALTRTEITLDDPDTRPQTMIVVPHVLPGRALLHAAPNVTAATLVVDAEPRRLLARVATLHHGATLVNCVNVPLRRVDKRKAADADAVEEAVLKKPRLLLPDV
jgi:hypothetical protein